MAAKVILWDIGFYTYSFVQESGSNELLMNLANSDFLPNSKLSEIVSYFTILIHD